MQMIRFSFGGIDTTAYLRSDGVWNWTMKGGSWEWTEQSGLTRCTVIRGLRCEPLKGFGTLAEAVIFSCGFAVACQAVREILWTAPPELRALFHRLGMEGVSQ